MIRYILLMFAPMVAVAGPLEQRQQSERLLNLIYSRPATKAYCMSNPEALYPTRVQIGSDNITIVVDCALWMAWYAQQQNDE